MKKLCIIVSAFILSWCLCFLFFNYLYKQTNHWQAHYFNIERFKNVPNDIELCNVGTSHTCWGLKWEDYTSPRAFNFANAAQLYDMDYVQLKQFSSKLKEKCIVIIPISYQQIIHPIGESPYNNYYGIIKKSNFPSQKWQFEEYLKEELFPIFTTKDFLHWIKNDISQEHISRFSQIQFSAIPTKEKFFSDIESIFLTMLPQTKEFLHLKKNWQLQLEKVSLLIEFCLENNFTPVLISTPIFEDLNTQYDLHFAQFWDYFYDFTKTLQKKYNLPYFDYTHDKTISQNYLLFKDAHHLNIDGAEIFTQMLLEDLTNAKILTTPYIKKN